MSAVVAPKIPTASPKKTPKAKKATAAGSHPKYIEMVQRAIGELKEKKGSSRAAILKHIVQHNKVGENLKLINAQVRLALVRGATSGALKQVKGVGATGSFKLGEPVIKKTVAKKPVRKPVGKPVVPKKKLLKKPVKKVAKKPVAKPVSKPKEPEPVPVVVAEVPQPKPATPKKPVVPKKAKTPKTKTPKVKKSAKSPKKPVAGKKPKASPKKKVAAKK